MNVRDELTMQVLEWRQSIRDMPAEELASVQILFRQVEEELKRRMKKEK